jgi:hypothetical protein
VSQDAIDFVSSIGDLPHALRDALVCRLNLRRILLQAVALGLDHAEEEGAAAWDQCLHELSPVVQTHGLGKAVPESFSTKVQRRLASTAPPRPIIDVSFGTAREFLERTFTDTAEGHNVLKCTRMSNVLVGRHDLCGDYSADFLRHLLRFSLLRSRNRRFIPGVFYKRSSSTKHVQGVRR